MYDPARTVVAEAFEVFCAQSKENVPGFPAEVWTMQSNLRKPPVVPDPTSAVELGTPVWMALSAGVPPAIQEAISKRINVQDAGDEN